MKNRISVAIAVYNEERNLAECLESVKDIASEIVLVDGSSKDKTIEIAKKFRARIEIRENLPMFHINKELANKLASFDWILALDADERVSSSLALEIQEKIKTDNADVYFIPRLNYFLPNMPLKKGGQYPDHRLRLFKKSYAWWPCSSVHEQMEYKGRAGYLKNDLLHYPHQKVGDYWVKFQRYTDLEAKEIKGDIATNLFVKPLFDPLQGFFSLYLRHKGFMDGIQGFLFALFSGLHFPVAYIKKLKMQN